MKDKNNSISEYIKEVSRLLPYSDWLKKDVLDELYIDVNSAMEDTNEAMPSKVFGNPLEVAQNICRSQDWHNSRVSWITRFFAWLIDLLIKYLIIGGMTALLYIIFVILDPFIHVFNEFSKWEDGLFDITVPALLIIVIISIVTVIAFLFMVAYNIGLEGRYNTTIGKKLFHLRVVDESGSKITWKQAIIRNLTKIVTLDFIPAIIPFDTIIGIIIERIDPEKARQQRGFDLLAETIVIKEPVKGGF